MDSPNDLTRRQSAKLVLAAALPGVLLARQTASAEDTKLTLTTHDAQ